MNDLDRMVQVSKESQVIGEFLDWLPTAGYHIARWEGDDLYLAGISINLLLSQYYDIDLHAVEMERRQILEMIRNDNAQVAQRKRQ